MGPLQILFNSAYFLFLTNYSETKRCWLNRSCLIYHHRTWNVITLMIRIQILFSVADFIFLQNYIETKGFRLNISCLLYCYSTGKWNFSVLEHRSPEHGIRVLENVRTKFSRCNRQLSGNSRQKKYSHPPLHPLLCPSLLIISSLSSLPHLSSFNALPALLHGVTLLNYWDKITTGCSMISVIH